MAVSPEDQHLVLEHTSGMAIACTWLLTDDKAVGGVKANLMGYHNPVGALISETLECFDEIFSRRRMLSFGLSVLTLNLEVLQELALALLELFEFVFEHDPFHAV